MVLKAPLCLCCAHSNATDCILAFIFFRINTMVTLVLLILHCHGHLATVVHLLLLAAGNVPCFEGRKHKFEQIILCRLVISQL